MTDAYAAPMAESPAANGRAGAAAPLSIAVTTIAATAVLVGAVEHVAVFAPRDATTWSLVTVALAVLGGVGLVTRHWGWASALLCACAWASLQLVASFAFTDGLSDQLKDLEVSLRATAAYGVLGGWIWGGAAAIVIGCPRGRVGAVVGATMWRGLVVGLGSQLVLPGVAMALLLSVIELSAARRDRFLPAYLSDLMANPGAAAIQVVGVALGWGAAMALAVYFAGFSGLMAPDHVPLEGHFASAAASATFTLGSTWFASRRFAPA